MIYWQITFKDGSLGYQVMGETTYVTDIDGNVLTGNLEYTTTDTACPVPVWA